jgi:hypothetical protein
MTLMWERQKPCGSGSLARVNLFRKTAARMLRKNSRCPIGRTVVHRDKRYSDPKKRWRSAKTTPVNFAHQPQMTCGKRQNGPSQPGCSICPTVPKIAAGTAEGAGTRTSLVLTRSSPVRSRFLLTRLVCQTVSLVFDSRIAATPCPKRRARGNRMACRICLASLLETRVAVIDPLRTGAQTPSNRQLAEAELPSGCLNNASGEGLFLAGPSPTLSLRSGPPLICPRRAEVDPI